MSDKRVRQVLITGIEGFVGRHLAKHLSSLGHQVIGLYWAEPKPSLPAKIFKGDICDFEGTKGLLERVKPDGIVHLAGISSVALAQEHPSKTYEVNSIGTFKLLEAVRQLKLGCRILLVSSADVYGRGERPHPETDPAQPLSHYAQSKLLAEELGRFYHRSFEIDVVILRPFAHTGPGQAPFFVFPKVASAIARRERGGDDEPVEMGDLDVRRDYTDVRDIVRAYELALEHCSSGETYNVTSGHNLRLQDGVEILLSLTERRPTIMPKALKPRPYDIPYLAGDAAKFHAATGWKPEIPIETTLRDLLEYYRSLPSAQNLS